jgi:hypothetical protein
MPSTASRLSGSLGAEPSRVSFEIGTLIAIVWMFSVFSGSTLVAAAFGSRWRSGTGRRAARSGRHEPSDEVSRRVPLAGEDRLAGRQVMHGGRRARAS